MCTLFKYTQSCFGRDKGVTAIGSLTWQAENARKNSFADVVQYRLLFLRGRVIDRPTERKVGTGMEDTLRDALEDFVTQRLDDLATDAPDAVTEAITQVGSCMERLAAALTEGQVPLWRELENALTLQTGEEMRYYYRAGFHDALRFLRGWSGGA